MVELSRAGISISIFPLDCISRKVTITAQEVHHSLPLSLPRLVLLSSHIITKPSPPPTRHHGRLRFRPIRLRGPLVGPLLGRLLLPGLPPLARGWIAGAGLLPSAAAPTHHARPQRDRLAAVAQARSARTHRAHRHHPLPIAARVPIPRPSGPVHRQRCIRL